MNGGEADLANSVFVYDLEPGEGAENGIAASKEGAVILTNQNCYLLQAENGVKKCGRHHMKASVQKTVKKEMRQPAEDLRGEVDVHHLFLKIL